MNCFDYMNTGKKYAHEILKVYKTLIRLEISEKKHLPKYHQHIKLLQELLEFEEMFYSRLTSQNIEFIEDQLLKKEYIIEDLSILDYSFEELDEETEEQLEWNRVKQKIAEERIKKYYSQYHFSKEQIGMIPLTPADFENFSLDYIHKNAVFKGCFNMELSLQTLYGGNYTDFAKVPFKYLSAYADSGVENYYLKNHFQVEKEELRSLLDSVEEIYLDDQKNYEIASTEFYSSVLSGYLETALELGNADLEFPEQILSLLILRDGLLAFLKAAPRNTCTKFFDHFQPQEGNRQVKNFLTKAISPILDQKQVQVKQMKYDKKISSLKM